MPGLSSRHTAHRAVNGKSLTHSLVLLTVTPVIVLVGLWGFAATALVMEGKADPARTDDLVLWAALGSIVAGAVLITTCVLVGRYSRSLADRLNRLHRQTVDLAGTELPQIVQQLANGDKNLPAEREPDRGFGTDEVGRLAYAGFHLRKAVTAALAEQARGREGSEQVFLGLARRTQVLISRLIPKLDELERKHHDSDLLKDIFAVDHLATRVRRHTENLVILGGAPPVRRWSKPVPIYEVLRSAISETEDYRRVDAQPAPAVSLVGPAVADVVHLLAELIENGTAFSPPETKVSVSASHVANGLALEVEDRGLGMPEAKYGHLNRLLAEPVRLDMMSLGETPRLGLFVVARLARRHHLEVSLRRSHYGGTLAIVLLPHELLEETKSLLSSLVDRRREESALPGGAGLSSDGAAVSETAIAAEPAAPAMPAAAAASAPSTPSRAGAELVGAPAGPPAGAVPAAGAEPMTVAGSPSSGDDGFPSYGGAGLLPSDPSEPSEAAADAGISDPPTRSAQPAAAAGPPPAPYGGSSPGTYGDHPSGPYRDRPSTSYDDRSHAPYHDPARTPAPGPSTPALAPAASAHHRDNGSGAPSAGTPHPPLPQRTSGHSPGRSPEPAEASSGPSGPTRDGTTGPDGMTTPRTLPTRVRGENLAAPLRRSTDEPAPQDGPPPLDRAGTAIGAIQSANRRARSPRPTSPPSPPTPASPATPSTPAPPAGGNDGPMAGQEYGAGSQES
jgi:signal transduction histidine kinase